MIVHLLTDDELARRHDLVDRDDIDLLVRSFYRYAAMDELLGPIFAGAGVDWPSHIETLTDFWAWQLLGERGYDANPLRAHEPVHARTPFGQEHYDRWIELFHSTVDEHFVGTTADVAKTRGAKMVSALQRLLSGSDAPATERIQPVVAVGSKDARR
jgi:hemoglobin